jgi:hypothetical protein
MRTLTLLLLAVLIAACNPLKHYQKVATDPDVTTKKKKILAPWIMANFPSEDRHVPGDTLVRIDTLMSEDTIYWETVDTLRIQEPVRTVTKYVTKTITIRDTVYRADPKTKAQLFYVTEELNKANATIASKDQQIEDLKIEIGLTESQVKKLWWWLIGICLASGAFVVLSIKKKIPFI